MRYIYFILYYFLPLWLLAQGEIKYVEKFECTSTIPTTYTVFDSPNDSPSFRSLGNDFYEAYPEYDPLSWTISNYIYPTANDAYSNTNPYPRDRVARSVEFDINNPAIFYIRIVENVTTNPRILVVQFKVQFSRVPQGRPSFDIIGCRNGEESTFDLNKAIYDMYGQTLEYEFNYYLTARDAATESNAIPIAEWDNFTTPITQTEIFLKVKYRQGYGSQDCSSTFRLNLVLPVYEQYIDPNNLKFCGVPYYLDAPIDPNNVYQFSNYEWYFNGELKAIGDRVLIDSVGEWTVYFNVNNGCRDSMLIIIESEEGLNYIRSVRSTMTQVIIEPYQPEDIMGYSMDGMNWQTSPIFNSSDDLVFTYYIKNRAGCIFGPFTVDVSNFFSFLSPNGDGINDFWDIRTSLKQTNATLIIYDRYGKQIISGLLKEVLPWDGKYYNYPLPTGTYWYKIMLNNEIFKEGNVLLKSN